MMRTLAQSFVFVALLLVAGACGLAADESPRVLDADDPDKLPVELRFGQDTTPSQGPGADQIHLVQDGRLVTVERGIVNTVDELMSILLGSTFPGERADGIRSALDLTRPVVQNIEIAPLSNVAIVDFAPSDRNPSNDEQKIAFAQIVYTLTSLPEIEAVQFVQTDPNDPEAGPVGLAVQTDTGSTLPGAVVTRDDFSQLRPIVAPQPSFDIPIEEPTATPVPGAPPTMELQVWVLNLESQLTPVLRSVERSADGLLFALIEEGLILGNQEEAGVRSALPPDAFANPVSIQTFDVALFEALDNPELPDDDTSEPDVAGDTSEPDVAGDTSEAELPNDTGTSDDTELPDDTGTSDDEEPVLVTIATVDLTAGSLPSADDGNELYLAAAQIVFTLTELDEIDQVSISIDGFAASIPWDDGVTQPTNPDLPIGLDRSNYAGALTGGDQPDATPVPTPDG